ncbi:MAG: hypothetical protein K2L11_01875 [Muribaculaceae bacterium]|nr:hypothetical protein [Muribaculaceae bacterium]
MGITRILITISRSDISMAYAAGGENDLPVSLPGAAWPLPLGKFGGPQAEYPSFRIGKGVEERLQQFCPPQTPDDNIFRSIPKGELPVAVIVESDVPAESIPAIVADLNKWGFDNVRATRSDIQLIDYYNRMYSFDGVVIVSSNGKDVDVSLFSKSGGGAVVRHTFEGRAVDNRIGCVALKIWEQVKDLTFDLKYETERDALVSEAEKFLKEGRREKNGLIRLSDNDTYQYILTRDMLSDIPLAEDSLESAFTDFLQANGMADRSRLAVILRNKAIGNHYVTDAVTRFFANKEEDRGSLGDALARQIANRDWEEVKDAVAPACPEVILVDPDPDDPYPGPEPQPEPPVEPKEFIPVEITARVEKIRAGLFKTKSVLHITIDLELGTPLPWDSVLCVQEQPLVTIRRENVVKEYAKGKRGPFALNLDLPLPQCPKARKLRVYLKPDPDEPVGINNAYVQDPVIVDIG